MRSSHPQPALAHYRAAVTELITEGESIGAIEEAIDELSHLTTDQKASLWLLAFSLQGKTPKPAVRAPGHLTRIE